MSETPLYENFRDFLANAWSSRDAIGTVIAAPSIRLSLADVPVSGTPRELWHSLLRDHPHSLLPLVEAAVRQFPKRENLIRSLAASYDPSGETAPGAIIWERNPYPGLRPIREGEELFGRETYTAELLERMQTVSFLTVYGTSGSGKSSLLRAGVVPRWRKGGGRGSIARDAICFTPGNDPFASLLAQGLNNSPDAKVMIAEASSGERRSLFADLQEKFFPKRQLLVVVDQGEQLIHRERVAAVGSKRSLQEIFLDCLFAASSGQLRVLVAMRDDYFPEWSNRVPPRSHEEQIYLRPPGEDDLRAIILRPARSQGVSFEVGLAEELVAKMSNGRATLPLLQSLLHQLWDKDKPEDGVLNQQSYDELGGVEGALGQQISDFIAEYCGKNGDPHHAQRQEEIRRAFLLLVRFDPREGNYHAVARPCDRKLLPEGLVEGLLTDSRRLLTNEGAKVIFTHEAVIQAWPDFHKVQAEYAEILSSWDRIEAAAAQYEATEGEGKKNEELWSGHQLTRALELAGRGPAKGLPDQFAAAGRTLTEEQGKFLDKGWEALEQRVKNRKRVLLALVASFLIASGSVLWGYANAKQAERSAREEVSSALSALKSEADARKQLANARHNVGVSLLGRSQLASEGGSYTRAYFGLRYALGGRGFESGGDLQGQTEEYVRALTLANFTEPLVNLPVAQLRHPQVVYCVAISADSKWVATGCQDGNIRIFELSTGKPVGTLYSAHGKDLVTSLAFSRDNKWLASSGYDCQVLLWPVESLKQDIAATKPVPLAKFDAPTYEIAFARQKPLLAAAVTDGSVRVVDVESGIETRMQGKHGDWAVSVDFDRLDEKIVSSGIDDKIIVWDLKNMKAEKEFSPHLDDVADASFDEEGTRLVTAGFDGRSIIVSLNDKEPRFKPVSSNSDRLWRAKFVKPDIIGTSGSDGTVRFVRASTGKLLACYDAHGSWVYDFAVSNDEKWLATVTEDGFLKIFNYALGSGPVSFLAADPDEMLDGCYSSDGNWFVSGGRGGAKLWKNSASGLEPCRQITDKAWIRSVAFSPDNDLVATLAFEGWFAVWKVADGSKIFERQIQTDRRQLLSLAFSRTGESVITGGQDGKIIKWNLDGSPELLVGNHNGSVNAIMVDSSDNIISGDNDGTMGIWRGDGTLVTSFKAHEKAIWDFSLSPKDRYLASVADDSKVKLWDYRKIESLSSFEFTHPGGVYSVAFNADGSLLATGGANKEIRIWDVESRSLKSMLSNFTGVRGIFCFSNVDSSLVFDGARGNIGKLDVMKLIRSHDGLKEWGKEQPTLENLNVVFGSSINGADSDKKE